MVLLYQLEERLQRGGILSWTLNPMNLFFSTKPGHLTLGVSTSFDSCLFDGFFLTQFACQHSNNVSISQRLKALAIRTIAFGQELLDLLDQA
jgi:hypothetical protein